MNLWIRSQDKKALIPINKMITTTFGNLIYDGIILGSYNTEERALEVLDEIHSYLIPKIELIGETPSEGKVYGVGSITTMVYQMPEE